jgi:uncharacterized protein
MTMPGRQRAQTERIRKVFDFLQSESTLVHSVRDAEGTVHSAPLFYFVSENLDLFWVSSHDSRHSICLLSEPRTSVAVFRSAFEWKRITGVQMEGAAAAVDGPERSVLLTAYCARFHLGTVLSLAAARNTLYRFQPRWIRYIDNAKRFGYKFELTL